MAKKLGLIDEVGTLQDAIALAKKAAGLKPDAEVELLILPQPKSVFEQLFGDEMRPPPTWIRSCRTCSTSSARRRSWRQMFREKILLWMPYQVRLR